MKVSVDFDGTITKSADDLDPGFEVLREDCKEVMLYLHDKGVEFVLLTARKFEYVGRAVMLCKEWGLPIDCSTPKIKQDCTFLIDDKNIDCDEVDWNRFKEKIERALG